MNTKRFYLLGLLFILIIGCKKDEEAPSLELSTSNISFTNISSEEEVIVNTNVSNWSVTSPPNNQWLTINKNSGSIKISVAKNSQKEVRSAEITVSASNLKKIIKVQQLGDDTSILVSSEIFTLSKDGEEFELEITSNTDYDIIIPSEFSWIKEISKIEVEESKNKHIFKSEWNKEEKPRNGEIQVNGKGKGESVRKVISITQKGQDGYDASGATDIKADIKLTVSSGTDTSHHKDDDITKSFDGDYNTLYHSNWNNSTTNYFPITLEYFFEDEDLLNYIIYHPRKSGANGIFKKVEIWVRTKENNTYVKKMDFDFENSNRPTKIVFENPIENPTAVKFVVNEGYGDGKGFASCAEMEFYKYNGEGFDVATIFADDICSELKPGVTDEDIANIASNFYRNIAFYMKANKYPREFRIQEYSAWDNPETMARRNKNSQYSEIDGVTGIYVDEGEKLVVFVGNTHGQKISLKFVNLDKPGGDGYYDNKSLPIEQGRNIITSPSKGLVYVMYNKDDYKNLQPIKIHFASGKVNGYFDSTKHDTQDWDRILGSAKYKYFDVVGKKAHLLFETEDYRMYCGSAEGGISVINQFDKLVHEEQILMGMYKYDRVPGNRALFHVIYRSYMYSTSYRTAYNRTTVSSFLTPDGLRTNPWGPAHELGHTHQVRPDIRWVGTTECTVNIPSLYIQTGWGNKSRIQRENRYLQGYKRFLLGKKSHFEGSIWENLVPFWQLKLYIENVVGYEDFYKDLYEYARNEESPRGAGNQMLNFAYIASKIGKLNLINFFESWGYFKEINMEIDDYGRSQVSVDSGAIEDTKSKINNLGYEKPAYAMRYINDNNWTIFKEKRNVTKGTAKASKRTLAMKNWGNVIAFEVFDADDELIFVSNDDTFDITKDYSNDMKVYAIQYDGTKIKVDF